VRPWDVIHFVGGLLTGLAAAFNPVLAVLMFTAFIVYEINEDWHLRDQAFKDIRAYAAGLYMVAAAGVVAWLLGG